MHGKSAASARFSYSTQSCDSFSYEYQIMVLVHVHHRYLHRCHGHHPKLESVIHTEMHKQHMLVSDSSGSQRDCPGFVNWVRYVTLVWH